MKRHSPLGLVLLFIALIPFAVCGTNPAPAPPQKPAPPQNNDDSDATGLCCPKCNDNTPNCLSWSIPFGRGIHNANYHGGRLLIEHNAPDPTIVQPAGLMFSSTLEGQIESLIIGSGYNTNDPGYTVRRPNGEYVMYASATGTPVGQDHALLSRVQSVAGGGLRRRFSNGWSSQYDALGRLTFLTTPRGETISASDKDIGLEIIRDGSYALRQIRSQADGLVDIVTINDHEYQIKIYAPSAIGTKANGLWQTTGDPGVVFTISAPNNNDNYDEIHITQAITNGPTYQQCWTYNDAVKEWNVALGQDCSAPEWGVVASISEEAGGIVARKKEYQTNGVTDYSEATENQSFPWGGSTETAHILDPDGINWRTEYEYGAVPATNSYGRVVKETAPDGVTVEYGYDAQGRKTLEKRLFKDNPAENDTPVYETIHYSYAPVTEQDTVCDGVDNRPRTVTRKVGNIITGITYYAYIDGGDYYYEVEERAATSSSAYGASGNLRTVTAYYGASASEANRWRVAYVKQPDGTQESFSYEYGYYTPAATGPGTFTVSGDTAALALRTTRIHGTADFPGGIVLHSTKEVTVSDERGDEVLQEEWVLAAANTWQRLSWKILTYAPCSHNLVSSLDSRGRQYNATWLACMKQSETLETGETYTYTYDIKKRVATRTLAGHGTAVPTTVTSYTYNSRDDVLTETMGTGNTTWQKSANTYNLAGQLIQNVDENGGITTIVRDRVNRTVTTTHRCGATEIETYYPSGKLQSRTGTLVIPEYSDYGVLADGSLWTQRNIGSAASPRWVRTVTNLLGQVSTVVKPGFGTNATVTEQRYYNGVGQLIKVSRTGQLDTRYEYNSLGEMTRAGQDADGGGLAPLSNDRIVDYDSVYSKDASNVWWLRSTQKIYAMAGSDIQTTILTTDEQLTDLPAGIVERTKETDIHGNEVVTTVTIDRTNATVTAERLSPESTVAARQVTVNGLVTSERTQTGLVTTTAYDSFQRKISVTAPRTGTTTFTYHTAAGKIGMLASETDAANHTTTYDYDAAGHVIKRTDALNKTARFAYNSRGQLIRAWGDTEYPVQLAYDLYGQQTTMTTFRTGSAWNGESWLAPAPAGDTTTWTYDEATGLLTAKTDAANHAVTYTYTADGNLASRTWARGGVTNYTYTAFGELAGVSYNDNNVTPGITYTYDRIGNLAQVADAAGTRTFSYNAELDLTSESISGIYNKTINREYTASGMIGRPLSVSIGNDLVSSLGYDTYGRIDQITTPAGSFNYTRIASSDLVVRMTRPNGIATIWSYEQQRDLVTQVRNGPLVNNAITNPISAYAYTNDAIGRRTAMGRSGSSFAASDTLSYGYNDRSEVISAQSNVNSAYNYAYNFDPIGNRLTASLAGTSVSYTTNLLNQYTAVNADQPTYDLDGNMLTRDGWTQTWNSENRLIRAVKGNDKLEFAYDYMGRRVEKKVYENNVLVAHTRFVYDGYKLAEELNALSSNAVLRRYSWQPEDVGLDVPLSVYDAVTNTSYCYTTDANKNVSELTDASGAVAAHYEYSPFGTQTAASGTYAATNPFRFSSEYFDAQTGLVYYNYRYYDSKLGRWISKDPVGETGGLNLYEIVVNNFINNNDKYGLDVYVVDGTWHSWEDNTNVKKFYKQTKETPKRYFPGPLCGLEVEFRASWVLDRVCHDYKMHCERNEKASINFAGWSRGAAVIMKVIDRLSKEGCCCNGKIVYPEINWVGFFDAVNLTPWDITNKIPDTVKSFTNIVKDNWVDNLIFPTMDIKTGQKTSTVVERLPNSDHGDIGRGKDSLKKMIEHAKKSGVKF